MKRIYYHKATKKTVVKKNLRFVGLGISGIGIAIVLYIFMPLLSWQLFYAPVFEAQKIIQPVPHVNIDSDSEKDSLIQQANAGSVDYTNAKNWFPHYAPNKNAQTKARVMYYTISVPKINLKNALVSAVDNDLSLHMINFAGTAIPPDNGTAVVFGHSTLPQLYDPTNYKTILSNAHHITNGDTIIVTIGTTQYTYKVFSTTVVDPDDTSVFIQNNDDSYLTIVTCTPPGTILYRLVIKARLQKI